jgi:hypothetical protein
MYAVHWGYNRIAFLRSSDGSGNIDQESGIFLNFRSEDGPFINPMMSMLFNDNHPEMLGAPVMPRDAYTHPFVNMTREDQAHVLHRAWAAVNRFCRDRRFIRQDADSVPLTYISQSSLALIFGK